MQLGFFAILPVPLIDLFREMNFHSPLRSITLLVSALQGMTTSNAQSEDTLEMLSITHL